MAEIDASSGINALIRHSKSAVYDQPFHTLFGGMVKLIFLLGSFAILAATDVVRADTQSDKSIHLEPIGSIVRGSFVLVDKVIPLPEGEFVLAITKVRDSTYVSGDWVRPRIKMVDVYLAQIDGRKLRAAVAATTVLQWGSAPSEWVDEPCKRDDTLFRLDLAKRGNQQNCLLVNHFINTLGPSATGVFADASTWLQQRSIGTPVAVMIDATITRVEVGEFLATRYAFNPEAFECDSSRSSSWAASPWHKSAIGKDPEKVRFVNSVVEWSKTVQRHINDVVEGRLTAVQPVGGTVSFGKIYRCGDTVRDASVDKPSTQGTQRTITERLRALENLREQKLISPAEYEERRRVILDSL